MHATPHVVSDVMTHTVVAVGRDAPFRDIVRLMDQWQVSALPVVEDEDRVVGVVSEADLLPKEEFRGAEPASHSGLRRVSDLAKAGGLRAADLMTSPAITVHADAPLAQAARLMAQRRVKRLPVVNDLGMLQGVVSRADLLKVFLRDKDDIAEEVRHEVIGVLFPDPVEPVRIEVADGVVTLTGWVDDTSLVPLVERLVRAVEGVVDVRCHLVGNPAGRGSR